MHVLLVPVGSHGDVHPFVGLGLAMARRGHSVEIITNAHFRPMVERVGLTFVEMGDENDYRVVLQDPDLWHPRRAFPLVARHIDVMLRRQYDLLVSRVRPGETVVVHGTLGLAANLLREVNGVPTATVHLQPVVLRSVHEPPHFPGLAMKRWWPTALKRALYSLMDRVFIEPTLGASLNRERSALGLAPVRNLFGEALHSPDLAIGLFPPWYAAPQPDWPSQLELTGFPLYDESGHHELDAALGVFLQNGPPPVVFTPGSANLHAKEFFQNALEACRRSGRRALFLTRFAEQVPSPLPDWALHRAYLPFTDILPRAVAVVHHGGIGTCAQGLAAGIPQLVMPLAHDQFDNAARLARLGVGRARVPSRFTPRNVARDLHRLIDAPQVAARARELAGRMQQDPGLDATAALLESRLAPRLSRSGVSSAERAPG
jgi:rhamnosyltransferase subunit B